MTSCQEFSHLIGNEPIKQYLKRIVERKCVGNSLLFSGMEGIGKGKYALAFAQFLMGFTNGEQKEKGSHGNHPDIRIYHPEGKIGMHSLDAMRRFSEEVYLAPYEAKWKIFILHDAERMLPSSANALLKTFEEPPRDTVIILLSHSPENLLPTILSRCRNICFQPISKELIEIWLQQKHGLDKSKAEQVAALAQGSFGKAEALLNAKGDDYREMVLKMLAHGKFKTYGELKLWVENLSALLEQRRQELESAAREVLLPKGKDDLSAFQKETIEKEIDGAASLGFLREVNRLFEILLFWFRDLTTIRLNTCKKYVFHKDYMAELEQMAQKGQMCSLEEVQAYIKEAKLAVERFSPLSSALETLLMKLRFL